MKDEQPATSKIPFDPFVIGIGYELIPLVDTENSPLLTGIAAMRTKLQEEFKINLPKIRIIDNMNLSPKEYRIVLDGVEFYRGTLSDLTNLEEASKVIIEKLNLPKIIATLTD